VDDCEESAASKNLDLEQWSTVWSVSLLRSRSGAVDDRWEPRESAASKYLDLE
jgi:hypothetical protein